MPCSVSVTTHIESNKTEKIDMSFQPTMPTVETKPAQVSTLMQVIAWIVLIIGVIIAGLGVLSLFGVITPFLVRLFGGIVAIALGAVLGVWGGQTLRGQKAPFQKPVEDASKQFQQFVEQQRRPQTST